MTWMRLALSSAAVLLAAAALGCGPSTPEPQNPPTLWLSFSQMEINLVLVDHEPPPF